MKTESCKSRSSSVQALSGEISSSGSTSSSSDGKTRSSCRSSVVVIVLSGVSSSRLHTHSVSAHCTILVLVK